MLKPLLCREILTVDQEAPAVHAWDERDIQQYFYDADDDLYDRLSHLTYNANLSLMLATCEWLEARLGRLAGDQTLEYYIEAGWAALLDEGHSEYFQLIDDDWRGPILGPLAVGIGIICEAFFEQIDDPERTFQACYAINIARHVMSRGSRFEDWLETAIRGLERHHAWAVEGRPKDDILGTRFLRGRLVSREFFSLSPDYDPDSGLVRLQRFRDEIRDENPFFEPEPGEGTPHGP